MKYELKVCFIYVFEDNYVDYYVDGYFSLYCWMIEIIKYKVCKIKLFLIFLVLIILMNM